MVIYVKGCLTCGKIGRKIREVMSFAREHQMDVEIKVSDVDPSNQKQHMEKLVEAGLPVSSYTAIVVEDSGKITRLAQWNS